MTALIDPHMWPEHPLIATLRRERDDALAALAAVAALADGADARPVGCETRGLVSARLIRAAIEPTNGGE